MLRVFVVEDDMVMQTFIKEILKEEGYEIAGVYDTGEDAVMAVANSKPDIIIMDIELNGYLDGIETAERIRESYQCPIIFMSGMSDQNTVDRTKLNETFAYLIKPFKPRELIVNIEMAMYKFLTDIEVKKKQQSLSAIIRNLGEGLIVTDKLGNVKIINPLAEIMLAVNASSCIDKDIKTILNINDMPTLQFLEVLKDLKKWPLKHNEVFEVSTELVNANNIHLPVNLNLNCIYDKNEQIDGYIFIIRDLSLQKKNQSIIERLSTAIRNNPVGILILNSSTTIEYSNPKFSEITGYSESDVLNKEFSDIYPQIGSKQVTEYFFENLRLGQEFKFELNTFQKNGDDIWLYMIVSPIKNELQELTGFIVMIEDITQSKTFSQQIELSEKKYKDLFEHSPVALWYLNFKEVNEYLDRLKEIGVSDLLEYFTLNPQSLLNCIEQINVLDINQSAMELVNWKDKNDLTRKFIEIFSANSVNFFLDIFNSIYHNQNYKQNDVSITLVNKSVKYLQIKWLLSLDNTQKFKNVLISTIDITEKIVYNDMLKKQTFELKERIKEQSALFKIQNLLTQNESSLEDIILSVASEIPAAFQQPGNTSVKIVLNNDEYMSPLFKTSEKFTSSDIQFQKNNIGVLTVYLTDLNNNQDFMDEEIKFINAISNMISTFLEFRHQKEIIDKKVKLETSVSKITGRFLSNLEFEKNVNMALKDIGLVTNSDRTYIFIYSDDFKYMDNRFEWCNNGVIPQIDNLKKIPSDSLVWWNQKLFNGKVILIDDVNNLPPEAEIEKQMLSEQHIKSLIAIPFYIKEKLRGFVGFDNCKITNAWDENDKSILQLFCQILGSVWERKLTSELLLNEHNFSISIINSVSVLIMVIKPDGRIVNFNRFCELVSGYKKHEIRNLNDLKKLHLPEEEDNLQRYLYNVIQGIEQDNIELIWRTKDKRIKIIHWSSNLIKKQDKVDYIIMNGNDITDIKRSEQLLIDREVQYRSLVQNLTIGIFRSTGIESGRFLQANKALADMLEYDSLNELLSQNESDIYVNPSDRAELLKDAIKTGEIQKKEILLKKKSGANMWVLLNAKTVYDDYGNFKWIDAFIEDITEIRKLEQQLIQSQKMEAIGQLAAGIAHEINTPTQFVSDNLNFIKDSFEAMLKITKAMTDFVEDKLSSEAVNDLSNLKNNVDFNFIVDEVPLAIKQSQEGLDRISTIIRAMKDFSHPANEDIKTMELNHMLESTLTVARNEWKYYCDIETELDPTNPTINCYPGELNQAFLNLIVNASHAIKDKVKESGQKGKITISTKALEQYVLIEISDTGIGIPPENKSKLFNPFFTTKEPGKGTGQGLSIVHHSIVQKHKGSIDVESEFGIGTKFIIRLPK